MMSAVTLVFAAACSVEETPSGNSLEQKQITLQAVAGETPTDDATRSIRLDNGDIWWTPGDQISVFYGSGADGGSCFTAQIDENKKVANFTGTIGVITGGGDISVDQTYFWGLYPYNDTALCDGTTIVTDVPDCQTAVAGTFAPGVYPWIGRSQGLLMSFYGLCGGIKFTVKKEGIKKATLKTTDGSAIAGRVRIALDANGIPSVQEVIDGKDEVVLEAPDGEYFIPGKYYFFVTLPHNFNTSFFTVKFETFTEEGTYERKRALEIKRADFIAFGSALDGSVTYEKKTGAIPVEDPAFKAYLVENYDTDGDGEISFEEAENVREISILPSNDHNLQSLRGIEYMPNLEVIDCWGDWYDTGNKSTGIDKPYYYVGPYAKHWENTWGPIGTLKYVDVTNNPKLRKLNVNNNSALGIELRSIDISHNPLLEELWLGMTWLEYPDISNNSALKIINFSLLRGNMPSFSNLPELQDLNIEYPQDDSNVQSNMIDVSNSPLLERLIVSNAARSLSDLSQNPKLRELHWTFCPDVVPADLSVLPELEILGVVDCNLSSLDVSNNTNLKVLYAGLNHFSNVDFSNNIQLEEVNIEKNQLTSLFIPSSNLRVLNCYENQLTSLNVTQNNKLEWLSCHLNNLSTLDVSNCTELGLLQCWGNSIASLDLNSCTKLGHLSCAFNSLSSLDVSNNSDLDVILCEGNHIGTLDLSNNPKLTFLYCDDCNLTSLDLSYCPLLEYVHCNSNYLTSLNVSKNLLIGANNIDNNKESGLWCCQQNDESGRNLLQTLLIAQGQTIPFVTENRSDEHIPTTTEIRIAPATGGGEGSTETPEEP